MSPLWPDFALARAAWANAVKSGLVDDDQPRDDGRRNSKSVSRAAFPAAG
jgi:hypothetical protein